MRAPRHRVPGFSLLTGWPGVSTPRSAMAARMGATVAQVVFRYAWECGIMVLTGTTSAEPMAQDLAAAGLALRPEELAAVLGRRGNPPAVEGTYWVEGKGRTVRSPTPARGAQGVGRDRVVRWRDSQALAGHAGRRVLGVAVPAVDGAPLGRLERDLGLLAAVRADRIVHLARAVAAEAATAAGGSPIVVSHLVHLGWRATPGPGDRSGLCPRPGEGGRLFRPVATVRSRQQGRKPGGPGAVADAP